MLFLGYEDLLGRLRKSDLVVDPPPDDHLVTPFSIALRLGTEFAVLSSGGGVAIDKGVRIQDASVGLTPEIRHVRYTVPLGDALVVFPSTSLLSATLEYVHIPPDLVGVLFPLASWERCGLSASSLMVAPGYRGKLTLALRNVSVMPVALYPGARVAHLCLSPLTGAPRRYQGKYSYQIGPNLSPPDVAGDIKRAKAALEKSISHATPSTDTGRLRTQLELVLCAVGAEKGKALETLVVEVFSRAPGLRVIKRNPRLRAEELDVVVRNELSTPFWRSMGSPIIVECKHWSAKVGAREVTVLVDKLRVIGPDARLGVLVAMEGVTGDFQRDAMLKIREARQAGRHILVLQREDLAEVADGTPIASVLERKYEDLLFV